MIVPSASTPAITASGQQTFFASVPRNLEGLLAAELKQLGAFSVKQVVSGVEFSGDLAVAYKACLWSRVANRILLPLKSGAAASPEQLYTFIQSIDWSQHLEPNQTLAVDFFCAKSTITHSQYGALKVKDAVVDQFRSVTGIRPSVDRQQPDLRINVYLFRNRVRVAIDLSGTSLHRRGYRTDGSRAPLKENLAAALLLAADWPVVAARGGSFYDPMCGSGTLLIEAALMASNTAPGLFRSYFGFLGWKLHQQANWHVIRTEAETLAAKGRAAMPPIAGSDLSASALQAAQANIDQAGLTQQITLQQSDVDNLVIGSGLQPGLVLCNPPYGVRLQQQESVGKLYAALGKLVQREFSDWQLAVFTAAGGLMHRTRLTMQPILSVSSGDLHCKLWVRHAQLTVKPAKNPRSPVADGTAEVADNMFANRLRKNLKNLRNWARKQAVAAWRVYDADMPEYAVAVDIYDVPQRHVVVQEYQAPAKVSAAAAAQRLDLVLETIPEVLQCDPVNVHLKLRKRQKGAEQYQREASHRREYIVPEGKCQLLVNFTDYLDTGLFLDHRKVRQFIAEAARGRRFLNLFAYTGSASVHAALGGAQSTLTLDLSNTYLDWARRNLQLNGLELGDSHRVERANCLEWLQTRGENEQFDLILLDPPTFSNSARMESDWDVQRDHASLIRQCMTALTEKGLLIFSNNFRRFKLDPALAEEFDLQDRCRWSLDRDFQRNSKIHHCWFFRHHA